MDVVERGDAERKACTAACDEQANRYNSMKRSGLVMKSEKAVYRREKYLSVVSLKKSVVAFIEAKLA
jgi:hypothetical protein